MVPMAILVGHKADSWGRKPIFLAGFAVLPIRGVLYTLTQNPYALVSIQVLDGIGAGIFGALVLYRHRRSDARGRGDITSHKAPHRHLGDWAPH